MDDARAMLDSLMGTHRNVPVKEARKMKGENFKGSDVCHFYLLGFCPKYEELFHSTKRDLGECKLVHSDAMKEEYEAHPDYEMYKVQYENKFLHYLEDIVRGADEWVNRERRNIQSTNQQVEAKGPNDIAKGEIERLNEQGQKLLQEAEELAEAGDIGSSKTKAALAEQVRKKADEWDAKARIPKSEEVCDICGLRTEAGDDSRRFTHLSGKIHLGYERIRNSLTELRAKIAAREDKEPKRGDNRGGDDRGRRRASRSRDRGERDRDRDRDRATNAVGVASEAEPKDAEKDQARDASPRAQDQSRDRRRDGDRDGDGARDGDRRDGDRGRERGNSDRVRDSDRVREGDRRGRDNDRGYDRHGGGDRGYGGGNGGRSYGGDRSRSHDRDRGRGRDYSRR